MNFKNYKRQYVDIINEIYIKYCSSYQSIIHAINNNELYNYPGSGEKVRAYDYWKRTIDKDNDYILMDQNKVNRMYNNPRSSSCPVCPLDINYPFSNYRSGR